MNIIGKGAEATLFLSEGCSVIKERISKEYRIFQIDEKLKRQRTRSEAKILEKLSMAGIPVPHLKNVDDKKMVIEMEFIKGLKVRDILHENPERLAKDIGRKIGLIHSQNIIHSDLTTSNMLFDNEVKFIDFGLSFFSLKIEDKAVDLHLFKQGLQSKHHSICEVCFASAIEGYKETCNHASLVIERFEKVEKRGRNKVK